jgi:serine/threonine protein kinase
MNSELRAEELLGTTIGPYTLDRLIGQGGFAWVFAAHRADYDRTVALKVLKPRYASDPEFEHRFRNEADIASQLEHPNIVRVLDIGRAGRLTYLAMDYYPDNLASRLQRKGPLPEKALIRMARDVASALHFAHQAGLVHRDIKTDNIMFTADDTAVIADFGIARAVSGYVSATGVNLTIGTPHYISPEQAQGGKLDGRSDLYALGVTLYKAATGELPFRSSDWFELARMHVEVPPPPPRAKRPELSRRFERIILKCLAKHPDDRYPSAAALVAELESLEDQGRRTENFGLAPIELAPPPRRRLLQPWILAIVGLVVMLAVAATVVLLAKR